MEHGCGNGSPAAETFGQRFDPLSENPVQFQPADHFGQIVPEVRAGQTAERRRKGQKVEYRHFLIERRIFRNISDFSQPPRLFLRPHYARR